MPCQRQQRPQPYPIRVSMPTSNLHALRDQRQSSESQRPNGRATGGLTTPAIGGNLRRAPGGFKIVDAAWKHIGLVQLKL